MESCTCRRGRLRPPLPGMRTWRMVEALSLYADKANLFWQGVRFASLCHHPNVTPTQSAWCVTHGDSKSGTFSICCCVWTPQLTQWFPFAHKWHCITSSVWMRGNELDFDPDCNTRCDGLCCREHEVPLREMRPFLPVELWTEAAQPDCTHW